MGKSILKQGITTNKLIITWKDYTPKQYGTERESVRCTSIGAAERILKKRNKRRIYFAKFFDDAGKLTLLEFNTKDTILQV